MIGSLIVDGKWETPVITVLSEDCVEVSFAGRRVGNIARIGGWWTVLTGSWKRYYREPKPAAFDLVLVRDITEAEARFIVPKWNRK